MAIRIIQEPRGNSVYEGKFVYPALKQILQNRLRYRSGVEVLLGVCRKHCPDPKWDQIAQFDYEAELQRFIAWYSKIKTPPADVEVLWLAPHDHPTDLNLRGSTKWSRDPEDWKWFYDDDYDGPNYRSQLVRDALELTEDEGPLAKRKGCANSPEQVVEFVYSLGLYGLCAREMIRRLEPAKILGRRSDRWFVVGHPDSVYGVILGRLTRAGWRTFKG